MIPQETVQKILDTARIEEVIGDFVTSRRRGADLGHAVRSTTRRLLHSTSSRRRDSTTASAATREDPP